MGTHYSYAGKGAVLVTSLNPILTFIIMTVIVKKINFKEIFGITVGLLGGLIIMDVFNDPKTTPKEAASPTNIYNKSLPKNEKTTLKN